MRYFFSLFLLLVNENYCLSQITVCSLTQINAQQKEIDPFVLQKELEFNVLAYNYALEHAEINIGSITTIEIPIVFHIIHQGGPENIADNIIINEVNVLNQRFSNSGSYNYANGVNVNIQFCLASVDPYGNPTTGITRTFSSLTNMPLGGDVTVKNLVRWNPKRYLNVWFVNECFSAMGSSAYSSFPWMDISTDGIMLTAPTPPIVGEYNYTIAHEVGHYFGLYHNNQGNSCVNFNCLLDGDKVCDTPPEFQPAYCDSNTCTTDMDDTSGFNPFVSDMSDVSNIMMPIVGCPYIFTQGQANRMNFFLTTTRQKLMSSNGCGQHPSINPLPTGQIGNITNTCNGYIFTSNTTNAEYIEWDFNGDGFTDAIGDTVSYLFPNQGNYTIVLRVFNEVGYDTDTLNFQSLAQNNTIFPLSTYIVEGNGLFACLGSNLTLTAVPGMAHYNWSTGDTTQTIVIPVTGPINVTLTCTDSLGMIWQRCPDPVFSWGVAPSPDPFSVSLITDDSLCTNQMFYAEIPAQPGTFTQLFSDGYPGILNNTLINLQHYQQYSNYIVVVVRNISNYCPYTADTIRIWFSDPLDTLQIPVVNGNYIAIGGAVPQVQWYFNSQAIPGANSDTLFMDSIGCYYYEAWDLDRDCSVFSQEYCQTVTATNNLIKLELVTVFPNPNNGVFTIEAKNKLIKKEDILLSDLWGRILSFEYTITDRNTVQIKTDKLTKGVYLLNVYNQNYKLIID